MGAWLGTGELGRLGEIVTGFQTLREMTHPSTARTALTSPRAHGLRRPNGLSRSDPVQTPSSTARASVPDMTHWRVGTQGMTCSTRCGRGLGLLLCSHVALAT